MFKLALCRGPGAPQPAFAYAAAAPRGPRDHLLCARRPPAAAALRPALPRGAPGALATEHDLRRAWGEIALNAADFVASEPFSKPFSACLIHFQSISIMLLLKVFNGGFGNFVSSGRQELFWSWLPDLLFLAEQPLGDSSL